MYQESFEVTSATMQQIQDAVVHIIGDFQTPCAMTLTPEVRYISYAQCRDRCVLVHIIEQPGPQHLVVVSSHGEVLSNLRIEVRKILKGMVTLANEKGWTVTNYDEKLLDSPMDMVKKAYDHFVHEGFNSED